MPQNKVNNPEGKNQYTGAGSKKPLITGALALSPVAAPPVNEGGYGSLADIQERKKQFDRAEYKRMLVQDEATTDLIKNLGTLRSFTAGAATLVGGTVASGIKATGLGLKDVSHQDIWSNSRTFATLAVSTTKEKQEVESKFYEKAKAAEKASKAAEERYIKSLIR